MVRMNLIFISSSDPNLLRKKSVKKTQRKTWPKMPALFRHIYIVKLRFRGVCIIFLNFALKLRLWVLVSTIMIWWFEHIIMYPQSLFWAKIRKTNNFLSIKIVIFSSKNHQFKATNITLIVHWI